jgi:hypothetical protein
MALSRRLRMPLLRDASRPLAQPAVKPASIAPAARSAADLEAERARTGKVIAAFADLADRLDALRPSGGHGGGWSGSPPTAALINGSGRPFRGRRVGWMMPAGPKKPPAGFPVGLDWGEQWLRSCFSFRGARDPFGQFSSGVPHVSRRFISCSRQSTDRTQRTPIIFWMNFVGLVLFGVVGVALICWQLLT